MLAANLIAIFACGGWGLEAGSQTLQLVSTFEKIDLEESMKLIKSIVLIGALLFSYNLFSGVSVSIPVFIDLENGYAEGDMFAARSSGNIVENIGCGRRISDFEIVPGTGLTNYAFCQARNSEGQYVQCFTTDPAKMDVIATASAYSFLLFAFDPAQPIAPDIYDCKAIWVSHQSRYLPNTAVDKDIKAK